MDSFHQEKVRVPSDIPIGNMTVWQLPQTTDPLIWLHFIWAKYTVLCNWTVLQYIENRVSCATPDISIPGPTCQEQEGVVEMRVDSYKSILFNRTPLYWLLVANLSHILLCISWKAMVVSYWRHLISSGMNHWRMRDLWFVWRPGIGFPTNKKWRLTLHIPRPLPIWRWYTA